MKARTLATCMTGIGRAAAAAVVMMTLGGGFSPPASESTSQSRQLALSGSQDGPPWHLDRIDQRRRPLDQTYVFDPPTFGSNVHVYVVDSGIRRTHNEFSGRVVSGRDFVDGDSNPEDCNGHGTMTAGVASGATYGVAKQVKLVAVRVANCDGVYVPGAKVQEAFDWIVNSGPKPAVISMSIGAQCSGTCPPSEGQAIKSAMARAIAAGIPVVISASNEASDACRNPFATVPGVIVVGASTETDTMSDTSNWGSCVDLWAPGERITAAYHRSDTDTNQVGGTSFAAPQVAGAIALMMSRPGWGAKTPAEIKAQLLAEATTGVLTGLGPNSPNRLLYTAPTPIASATSVALAARGDNKLELFGVNAGGTLFHRTQTAANAATWNEGTPSIAPNWSTVCAQTNGESRIALVGLQPDHKLWYRRQTLFNMDAWTSLRGLDGLATSCGAALADSGRLHLVVANAQGQLFRRTQTAVGQDDFTQWATLSTAAEMAVVAAERNGNGQVELFALTRAGRIWHCWNTDDNCGSAESWHQLSGQLATIAVARNVNGRLSVFGATPAGELSRRDALPGTNQWSQWQRLDLPATMGSPRSVAAEPNQDGRIVLLVVNTAGQVWQATQTSAGASTYGPWTEVGGQLRP